MADLKLIPVYMLARELEVDSNELIRIARRVGVGLRASSSPIHTEEAGRIRQHVALARGHVESARISGSDSVNQGPPADEQMLPPTSSGRVRASNTHMDAPGVFISYRRADAQHFAGRLYDKLEAQFGAHRVFFDVDSISLGRDFLVVLGNALENCSVVIVVIGRSWLSSVDKAGRRRIDDPDDLVRMEVEEALRRDVAVIPLLIDGVEMPRRDELPTSLQPLVRRQAREISHAGFAPEVRNLISAIERILAS
jgi:hypothetical protein